MKKKITAIALVVCMLAIAIAGATMAYFTDTEESVENVMTVGKVDIYMDEEFNEDLPLLPNVEIEKLVEVENRGTVDTYVRVLLAVEDTWDISKKAEITYTNESYLAKCAQTVIDGALYTVYEYVYPAKLGAGESFTSLESILWNKGLTQEEAAILGESFNVLVMAQAVQADGVANNAAEALNTAFAPVDYAYAAELFGGVVPNYVATNDELAAALTNITEEIAVVMTADASYDVAAWDKNAMGGDSTKTVTIIGANETTTLTFNQKDSDWDNVVTKNNAELVLTGLKLTSSGHNNGPWNRHDINFACPVVMTSVESDKAFAFKNSADLTNVKIADANTSDTYAIWIQPNGQTVTLDGVLIDMEDCTDGRGIKIDEQYVSAPEKVTLNVSNTTFITEEKAAILVKSAAGADINLSNVDIRKVAADSVNPVWVDEASAAYYDLVTVTGGSKILEPKGVSSLAELQAAIDNVVNGDCIVLGADIEGNVTVTQKPDVKFTIDGNGHTFDGVLTVDGKSSTYITAGLTVKNMVFKADSISADACIRLGDGTNATRYTCNVTVENCTFDVPGAVGVKSYTGGDKNLTITGCTVTNVCHSLVQAKGIDGVLVENCKVYSKNGLNFNNSTDVTISNCEVDVKGYAVRFGESSGGVGFAETYLIKDCTLKSANDDGDATIILRGTADYATLTIVNTTIVGTPDIANTATGATVIK